MDYQEEWYTATAYFIIINSLGTSANNGFNYIGILASSYDGNFVLMEGYNTFPDNGYKNFTISYDFTTKKISINTGSQYSRLRAIRL